MDSWWHIYQGTITTEEFFPLRARWVTDGERCLFNSFPGRRVLKEMGPRSTFFGYLGEEACVSKAARQRNKEFIFSPETIKRKKVNYASNQARAFFNEVGIGEKIARKK